MRQLKDSREYRLLRDSRKKVVGKYFIVVYLYDDDRGDTICGVRNPYNHECMAGFTVSKKVGNAVTRNKVKRRIRAFLRDYPAPVLSIPYKCNIIAIPAAVSADWESFTRDLTICLSRIGDQQR